LQDRVLGDDEMRRNEQPYF